MLSTVDADTIKEDLLWERASHLAMAIKLAPVNQDGTPVAG